MTGFFALVPLLALALIAAAGAAGVALARHFRYRTSYTPLVLAAVIAAPVLPALTLLALIAPLGLTIIVALLWLGFASGAGFYVRTRWARELGVGELGAMHRERGGVGEYLRDRRNPAWREELQRETADSLLTPDGLRCILGPEIARSDGRPTGGIVSVKLGRMNPGPGGNSGVVGLLIGRPESGKTTTSIRLLHATAEADPKGSILIVDPKGDQALREAGRAIARMHGTRYWEWSEDSPLDPLATTSAAPHLAAQAAVARIMASQEFTEPYYEGVALEAYTDVAEFLTHAGRPLSLLEMAKILTPTGAQRFVGEMMQKQRADEISREIYERVADWYKAQNEGKTWGDLKGAATRLTSLARSGLGVQFAPHTEGGRTISDMASTPGVSYLRLDAGMWPDAAKQIAELLAVALMQDVGRIAETSEHTITMFVDELGAIPAGRLDAVLQRGRSAGFSVYLAAQTLAGIGAIAPELVSQITGTLSWLVGHASIGQSEGGEDDAERIGRLAGTRIEHEMTTQTSGGVMAMPTGAGSQRQVDAYILHPNLIRSLGRGKAVVVDVDQPTTDPARGRLCGVAKYEAPTERKQLPLPQRKQLMPGPPVEPEIAYPEKGWRNSPPKPGGVWYR